MRNSVSKGLATMCIINKRQQFFQPQRLVTFASRRFFWCTSFLADTAPVATQVAFSALAWNDSSWRLRQYAIVEQPFHNPEFGKKQV